MARAAAVDRTAAIDRTAAAGRTPSVNKARVDGGWWEVGGQTCVAAYQAIGAASLGASCVNLAQPGVYDAAPADAPTFDSATGWAFDGATQYLDTGVAPGSGWSMLVRYADAANDGISGMETATNWRFFVRPLADGSAVAYGHGAYRVIRPELASGILGIAGQAGYRDGALDISDTDGWTPGDAVSVYIGSLNAGGAPVSHLSAKIQAVAIYSTTLSAPDVAALTARMQALEAIYQPSGAELTLRTASTSGTWSPPDVTKTGDPLIWWLLDSDGNVVQTQTANQPVFDLSALAGEKTIHITSTDGWDGLTHLYLPSLGLTSLDVGQATSLAEMSCNENSLTALDVSANTLLEHLACSGNGITALDLSANSALASLDCSENSLDQDALDAILLALHGHGLSDGMLRYNDQTPAANPTALSYAAYQTLAGLGWTFAGVAPPGNLDLANEYMSMYLGGIL